MVNVDQMLFDADQVSDLVRMVSFENQVLAVVSPNVVKRIVEALLIVPPYFFALLAATELGEVLVEIASTDAVVKLASKRNGDTLLQHLLTPAQSFKLCHEQMVQKLVKNFLVQLVV